MAYSCIRLNNLSITMITEVSSGVIISVDTKYEMILSHPLNQNFVFSYSIEMENRNDFSIQLLRRHWFIYDSCGIHREVEGPGVVGEQPVLLPGEKFSYRSACDLRTERGKMKGFYTMQTIGNKGFFNVRVPEFILETPYSCN
jgi:ApaG protein